MGIKFRDRVSAGVPVGGDVKEREIVFDLKNNSLYSSNDGLDLVRLGGDPEQGGIAYNALTNYVIDDIVAVGQNIYIANAASVGQVPGTDAEWTALSLLEKGGLAYNNTLAYNIGDIVSEAGVIYSAIIAVPVGVAQTPPNATYWATPSVVELGGRIWATATSYAIGDIVTDDLTGDVYSAVAAQVGNQPSADGGTNWVRVGTPERGGIAWDNTVTYVTGDLVTEAGITYVGITPITASAPSLGNVGEWKTILSDEVDTFIGLTDTVAAYTAAKDIARINVGNNGIELVTPATVAADINVGDLKDIDLTVAPTDGQVLVWDNTNSEWIAGDAAPDERGGILWLAGTDYVVGDVTTDAGNIYICTTDDAASGTAPSSNANWAALSLVEKGGLLWNTSINYNPGDVVSLSGVIYAAVNANNADVPPSANWATPSVVETGGKAWTASTGYAIGDIVTEAGVVYHCTAGNSDAVFTIGNWSEAGTDVFTGLTDTPTNYTGAGDQKVVVNAGATALVYEDDTIANINDVTLTAPVANEVLQRNAGNTAWVNVTPASLMTAVDLDDLSDVPVPVLANDGDVLEWNDTTKVWDLVSPVHSLDDLDDVDLTTAAVTDQVLGFDGTNWIAVDIPPEIGGREWITGTMYLDGDVVTDGGNVYIANTDITTPAILPSALAGEWDALALLEKGGLAWNSTITYAIGDIVSDAGVIYAATAPSTGQTPPNAGFWATPSVAERGGILWATGQAYQIGDTVSYGGAIFAALTANTGQQPDTNPTDWATAGVTAFTGLTDTPVGYTAGNKVVVNAGGTAIVYEPDTLGNIDDVDLTTTTPVAGDNLEWDGTNWVPVAPDPERGGILHNDTSFAYKVGDTATIFGDSFLYHCILDHTSAVTCVGDTTNWTQPVVGYTPIEYNYTSDLSGAIPPAAPTTGNGPHYFAVAVGSAGRTATVWVEGFELRADEFNTTLDGYVEIIAPVSDNSWVKIII